MKIKLTIQNSIALAMLSFLMQETHELAHTFVGRLICGCWGERNFNVWDLCDQCASEEPLTLLATFAGPMYTFSFIWLGYYLLTRASASTKSIGFALVVSSMPLSRILNALPGSGDEVYGFTRLGIDHSLAWASAAILVLALTVPPMVKIYRMIENRRKPLWIIGLLLAPFLLVGIVVFGILQGLVLNNGILDDYWILGSPMLVTLWLFFMLAVFAIFAKHIPTLLKETDN